MQAMTARTSQYTSRLPKLVQKALPLLIAAATLLAFFSYTSSGSLAISKRDVYDQTAFGATSKFPKKIWQTWKVDPLSFEDRDQTRAKSWISKNPGHRYEVLTDYNDHDYVETHFGPKGLNRPDIIFTYRSLTAKILKADLLRYLIMYVEGGVYADIDVEALKPIDRFIPDRYDEADVEMVIGVEIDQPEFDLHPFLGKKSHGFCQWTFMCKPRLPVILKLIENVLTSLDDISKRQNVPISQIHLDFDDVLSVTGPTAFTKSILEDMSERSGHPVNWDPFHSMTESRLVAGILVLTVEAFAAAQGHSDSGSHESKAAMVRHHYHASGWPDTHPRYNHPLYGPVEICNWNLECVNQWDSNMAAFEALNPEQQAEMIKAKQAADQSSREAEEEEQRQRLADEATKKWEYAVKMWEEMSAGETPAEGNGDANTGSPPNTGNVDGGSATSEKSAQG